MRLIDADALKDDTCKPCDRSEVGYTIEECREHGCGLMAVIDKQPTVDAEPVRHGRWLPVESAHDTRIAKCSICGFWQKSNGNDKTGNYNIHKSVYRYCAACGAKMDGGAENEIC